MLNGTEQPRPITTQFPSLQRIDTICRGSFAPHAQHWCQAKMNTHNSLADKILCFMKARIKFASWNSLTLNLILVFFGIIYSYINTISFLTTPIYYKPKNTLCADQYIVNTMYPAVYMMCEVPATVYMYRAECSLSDADAHFFLNNSPCTLLNVSLTNPEQIAKKVRISNNKRIMKFKQSSS